MALGLGRAHDGCCSAELGDPMPWQLPLWGHKSQQVYSSLCLAKNAAVGKGSEPLSGVPESGHWGKW